MKTVDLLHKMMLRRKPLRAASLMIIMMKVFSGYSLTCHRAEYLIGGECCPKCPAGNRVRTDCTEFSSTSCLPCIVGTYMNQPTGLKQCFACANCDAGSGLKITRSCTTTSDSVCEPLEGFYCMDPTEDSCARAVEHTSCKPGQYISQKGTALTDTVCTDCSGETFSDGTFTSCRPHTQCESKNLQLIKPGSASADAECGERGLNVTVIVSCMILLIVLLIGILAFYCIRIRRRGSEQRGNAGISRKELTDEEQTSGILQGHETLPGGDHLDRNLQCLSVSAE